MDLQKERKSIEEGIGEGRRKKFFPDFVNGIRYVPKFIFYFTYFYFGCGCLFVLAPFVEKIFFFSPLYYLGIFLKNEWIM